MADTIPLAPMLAQASPEEKPPKNVAAQELKRKQMEALSPEQRREIARKAAQARWAKSQSEDKPPPKKRKKKKPRREP